MWLARVQLNKKDEKNLARNRPSLGKFGNMIPRRRNAHQEGEAGSALSNLLNRGNLGLHAATDAKSHFNRAA